MNQKKVAISIVVPTKDRPRDLTKLLTSIQLQSRRPDAIIIVDGSETPMNSVIEQFSDLKNLELTRVFPPSLPKQRNVGISKVDPQMEWIGFLDDDLVLEPDALSELEKYILTQGKDVKGIGLSILNQPVSRVSLFNHFFLMGKRPGFITSSGYAGAIPPLNKGEMKVNWLYGGATFWHRSVFDRFRYDEWFHGTGYMEDVDFSYQVSRDFLLRVCGSAQCNHYHHPISRSKQKAIGEWQIISWWYFVNKFRHFNFLKIGWSMTGLCLKNLLGALFKPSWDSALRFQGNLWGIFRILKGNALNKGGFSK